MRKYLTALFRIHMQCFDKVFRMCVIKLSTQHACRVINIRQWARGKPVRFFYIQSVNLYMARDSIGHHYFADRMRGLKLYQNGLQQRGQLIASSYFIEHISFDDNDVVIDCGANYADLYLYLKSCIKAENYHTFEPDPDALRCIVKNAVNGNHHNKALHYKDGVHDFYISSAHGDSSLDAPAEGYTNIVSVQTCTLDHYILNCKLNRIKLLKLEAEGLEVEILKGAEASLSMIEYIAVDGGAERGIKAQETLSGISNVLIQNGFEMVGIDIPRAMGRALFRKTA